ncbi:MAG: hypothetical protein B7X67_04995 [Rhizobiales bacterium 39-66-18]|nr:MAG: hypothetical protein B7X67_04995 [Rhizobiales bacterium 39-66-18]
MTPKQHRFVEEYLIDLNATQAAVRAGYSPKTAAFIASENLRKPYISEEIDRAMARRSARTEITQDRVLQELARLAFLDIGGAFAADGTLLPLQEMAPDVRAAIAGLEVNEILNEGAVIGRAKKIRLTDKVGALTLLMRHLGMLNDKLKAQGDMENPLLLLIQSIQGSALKPVPTCALPRPYGDE